MSKKTITRLAMALKKKFRTPEDALRALEMDPALLAQDTATEDAVTNALAFLSEKLDSDDLAEVKRLLIGRTVEGSDYPQKSEESKGEAKDTVLPRPGGKMVAQDAKPLASFRERWPEVARIKVM